ncbi:DUF4179 domain-containing protein [Saccharibacillus alkalitolerans]|uniref:DUF4179 domain-containing protein n=1 Tax=Saccharibacillus alkalitolerans TaxID=2705290 RepID=A0ABX0F0G8_9BACL|nr:DUF4179 domain-containing protein [Saccharibacillus alkalitolerans]NGZ73945.1 DUF4179 domain-containing protein [Saccharibacillus alkalitolerans]
MNTNLTKDKRERMDGLENALHRKIGKASPFREPDYDSMWLRMESQLRQEERTDAAPRRRTAADRGASRPLRKTALAAALGAALIAVPAYAAVQYDWGGLLQGREGVRAALEGGLGQEIGRSVTHDGVTLTLHTAFVDEGRTLILYSLESASEHSASLRFSKATITDAEGETFEVQMTSKSEDENGAAVGYFETDWSPKGSSEAVRFSAEGLDFHESAEQPLSFDVRSPLPQTNELGVDGFRSAQIQALDQGDGRTLLRTTLVPESGAAETTAFPRLAVYDRNGNEIQPSQQAIGAPGEGDSTLNDTYYDTTSLLQKGISFKWVYERITQRSDKRWEFPLVLDKSQVEHASAKQKLDVRIGEGDQAFTADSLTVSPSQIRIGLRGYSRSSLAFAEFKLAVDGRELEQPLYFRYTEGLKDPQLILERPADLALSADSTIELLARHAIVTHKGDLPHPVLLTNIGEGKQTVVSQVGGYPVSWTYYRQNGDLYVVTGSADPNFGGIGQTHIGTGRDKLYTEPISDRRGGTGSNLTTEIYRGYAGDTAEMHIFSYTEHMPDREVSATLYPAD